MSRPDFQAMSQKDLRGYVLAHQDDQDAFYAYVDKMHAEANWVEMPAMQALDDFENYPELVERFRKSAERRKA